MDTTTTAPPLEPEDPAHPAMAETDSYTPKATTEDTNGNKQTVALESHWDRTDRLAAIRVRAEEIFGDIDPERLRTFDSLVQLSNLPDKHPATVPDGTEFQHRMATALRTDATGTGLRDGVNSLVDALEVYQRQTTERWLPLDMDAMRDYAGWHKRNWRPPTVEADVAAGRVPSMLKEFAEFAGMPMARAATYERAFSSFVDMARTQLPCDQVISPRELVDVAHESLYDERAPQVPDPRTARTVLEVAQALEIYGLRTASESEIEYRTMLYEAGQLLDMAADPGTWVHDQAPTQYGLIQRALEKAPPLRGTGDFRGLERLAESVHSRIYVVREGGQAKPLISAPDPHALLHHYRRIHNDLIRERKHTVEGLENARITCQHLHTYAPIRPVSEFTTGFDARKYNTRDYADNNYGYEVIDGYPGREQWIPRRKESLLVEADGQLTESIFRSARDAGHEPGDFASAIVHGAGVNPYPNRIAKNLGVAQPEVSVYRRNTEEVKYQMVYHGIDSRKDGILHYEDEYGVSREYAVRVIWNKFGDMVDTRFRNVYPERREPAGGDTSVRTAEPLNTPVRLKVGDLFDHTWEIALQVDPSGELYRGLRGQDAGVTVDGIHIPRVDGKATYDLALAMFVLDSIFGDATPLQQIEASGRDPIRRWKLLKMAWFNESGKLRQLTEQWGLPELHSLVDRNPSRLLNALMRWAAVDGLIASANKMAVEGLALNDGGGWATGTGMPLLVNTRVVPAAFMAYSQSHPRVKAATVDSYVSTEQFSETDKGLGMVAYVLLPHEQAKGPGTMEFTNGAAAVRGGERIRMVWSGDELTIGAAGERVSVTRDDTATHGGADARPVVDRAVLIGPDASDSERVADALRTRIQFPDSWTMREIADTVAEAARRVEGEVVVEARTRESSRAILVTVIDTYLGDHPGSARTTWEVHPDAPSIEPLASGTRTPAPAPDRTRADALAAAAEAYAENIGQGRDVMEDMLRAQYPWALGRIDKARIVFSELLTNGVVNASDGRATWSMDPVITDDGRPGVRISVTHKLSEGQAAQLPRWTASDGPHPRKSPGDQAAFLAHALSDRADRQLHLGSEKRSVTHAFEFHQPPAEESVPSSAPPSLSSDDAGPQFLDSDTGTDEGEQSSHSRAGPDAGVTVTGQDAVEHQTPWSHQKPSEPSSGG